MLQGRTNNSSVAARARGASAFALAMFVVATVGLGLASYVGTQAASAGASSFNIGPSPVTVGSAATYSFTIRNLSDDPQAAETVELTKIQGYPACNVIDSGSPGSAPCDSAADQNPAVFTPAATATGAAGTACAGTTFNVIEAASGLWTFVPTGAGAPVVLQPTALGAGNPLTTCIIQGTVSVDALPGTDANLAVAGIQTRQLSYAEGFATVSKDEFTGTGTTSVSVQDAPKPPDIKVTKVGNGPIKAGANAVFTMVVTDLGPGTASSVTLNDPLPPTAGSWTVGGPNAASCKVVADLLTCAFGDLAEGATRTITVTSPTVASAGCAPVLPLTTRTATTGSGGVSTKEGSCGSRGDCRTPSSSSKTATMSSTGSSPKEGSCGSGDDCRTPSSSSKTATMSSSGGSPKEGSCGSDDDCRTPSSGSKTATTGSRGSYGDDDHSCGPPKPPPGDSDCGPLPNSVTVAATNEGPNLANNKASATVTVECKTHGRMTGGGSVSHPGDVTHGFELHCDRADKPNNLEINWGKESRKYRFHLEELLTAVCTDTSIRQAPPEAPFDTYVGKGTGRFGEGSGPGKLGYTIEFTLTDGGPARGEPGIDDTAAFKIYETANPTNVVLTANGKVSRGNHQAHR